MNNHISTTVRTEPGIVSWERSIWFQIEVLECCKEADGETGKAKCRNISKQPAWPKEILEIRTNSSVFYITNHGFSLIHTTQAASPSTIYNHCQALTSMCSKALSGTAACPAALPRGCCLLPAAGAGLPGHPLGRSFPAASLGQNLGPTDSRAALIPP